MNDELGTILPRLSSANAKVPPIILLPLSIMSAAALTLVRVVVVGRPRATTASAVPVREDAMVLALELEKVPPVPRHYSLHVMRGRKRVQEWIDGRVEWQQVDHDEGVDVNWGGVWGE